jgi:CPA2 family monovalent cation:H+ antiporter-2
MRHFVFGLGGAQVALTSIVLTEVLAQLFDMRLGPAFVCAAALSMSSTAIVIPVLAERKRLNKNSGRAAFSILLFQDLMVAPLLFVIPLLAGRTQQVSAMELFATWAPAMVAVILMVAGGRLLLRPLFHLVAAARSTELFMACCLLVVVGASVATAAAGLSMGLGAFVAGLLLAETEFRREIEVTVEPFQGLLLGLFFLSTGAGLDLQRIAAHPAPIFMAAIGLVAVKAAIIYLLSRAFSLPAMTAGEVALLLAPGGEFAFLMIGAAMAAQVMPAMLGGDVMIVVTLSMMAIPALGAIGAKLRPRAQAQGQDFTHLTPEGEEADSRVVIVGYGRVGKLVGEMLERHGVQFVAVDGSTTLVSEARDAGVRAYWGNATRAEFLQKIGLNRARALVVTMDAPLAVELVVTHAHALRPDMTIVARARDAEHATHLYELGVTDAIPETIEASLQLAEALLVDIGVAMGYVIASIHEKRDEYRKILQPHGDRRKEKRDKENIKMSKRVRDMRRPKPEQKGATDIAPQPAPKTTTQ